MTVLTDLFEDLRDVQEEALRQARGLRFGHLYEGVTNNTWAPSLDIAERQDSYLVNVDLPGVAVGDLQITCQAGVLTIQGERHGANDPAKETVHRAERRFGPFLRSITLPSNVMADAIDASTQDGVLQIMVPKPKEAHAKRIHVHPGTTLTAEAPTARGGNTNHS